MLLLFATPYKLGSFPSGTLLTIFIIERTATSSTKKNTIMVSRASRWPATSPETHPPLLNQSGDAPTEKQAGFINSLAKQTGEKVTIEGMDRANASSKIEDLLEKKDGGQTGAGAVIDRSEELKDDVSWLSP